MILSFYHNLKLSYFLIFVASNISVAQFSSHYNNLSGNVKDFDSSEPLIGVNIVVVKTNYGTSTDRNGNFALSLPEGQYDLKISMVGYENLVINNVLIMKNVEKRIPVTLRSKAIGLESVVVTPKPEKYDATGLTAKLDRNMIQHSPGSAQDIFWTLQTLPGVSSGSDDSKLYVRGGTASENLVLFDGAVFSNPYHFEFMGGGLFSIFNSRLVEDVKFYTGGFPARYGDRLSSVLIINNKTASKDNYAGELNLSLTDLNGIIEFPIKILNASGFMSIRRSYFDVVYNLLPDLKNDNDAIPYFLDGYSKLDFDLSKTIKLTLTGLSSKENLKGDFNFDNFKGAMRSDGYNQLYGARLNFVLSENLLNETNVYYSHSDKKASYPQSSSENYNLTETAVKNDLSIITSNHDIHLGGWLVVKNDEVFVEIPGEINFYTLEDYKVDAKGKYNLLSFYLEDKVSISPDFKINGGIRFDYLDRTKKGVISPRFNMAYSLNDHMSLSFDYGWYYQSPSAYEIGVNPKLNFKKAESIGVGIKHQISDELIVNFEFYNKRFFDLVTLDNINWKFSSNGFGFARGAELYVQFKPSSNLVGWISYSYSLSKRKEGTIRTQEYFAFDRTNLISAILNYRFEEVWAVGAKFRYGDGTPYTPVIGKNYDNSNYIPILGRQNSSRYPAYSRFDLRLTRQLSLANYPIELYLEVLNLFNSKNVVHWMYDNEYSNRTSMTVLPTIPVIGINLKI
ncbi:MAG: TonB-dependent receptor [Ignavibacteriae bacterium]|nr:TonB-dependent receptor [Ignavibacteriota bacterium]